MFAAHGQIMNTANTGNNILCAFQETSPFCEAEREERKNDLLLKTLNMCYPTQLLGTPMQGMLAAQLMQARSAIVAF